MKIITCFLAILTLIVMIATIIFEMNLPYKLNHWLSILLAPFVIMLGFYSNKNSILINKLEEKYKKISSYRMKSFYIFSH
ncbi:hypothetical protein [Bacillus cereus]|uniref:hypothetical protein n=1 Tax=Bacillus cereus TaxID=1396 RepID=UPI003629DFD7|nr:hypothetical protein [Bacillus cereus]